MLKNTLHLLLIGLLAGLMLSGCVIKDDPCDGVTCDGHGTCDEYEGEAFCTCDDGYTATADGLGCELAGYRISLTWSYTGAADCTAAQVASVNVSLLDGGTEVATADIACTDGDGANIDEVDDGSYDIELRATSNTGELTYYGEGSVTIAGADNSLDITMDAIGYVVFTWDFAGQTCTDAGVDKVKVKINTEDASSNLYTAFPVPLCTEDGHSTETTAFFYLDNYNLVLEGICISDAEVHYDYDAIMMITEKGENNYGNLSLDAIGGGCP